MIRASSTLRFLLGVGLCSLGGAMLYIYYKNKDEDDLDVIDSVSNQNKQKLVTVRLVVSNEIVPIVIGRHGANVKIIEDKTGAVINFREKDDSSHYCEIVGSKSAALKAKEMLIQEMQKSPTIKVEIFIPQSACGKIIGRCGESLQEICRKSLAKVSVDSSDRDEYNKLRRVLITGNRNQVKIAKELIEQKVKEDEECRKSIEQIEQKREPRRSPTTSISSNQSSMTSSTLSSYLLPPREKLNCNDNKKFLEVYVSAIATPSRFWIQLIGPQSRKLDELVETMTEYYQNIENQNLHKIADPYLGQIVAALYKYDEKWYRAEIVGILPNEYNPRDVVLDLYFVDYGDSEYVAPHEVFELRTDFLTLRFQAIQCFLAHVKPAPPKDDDTWDERAITRFEELTHVASWKKLTSRVVTYKERPKGTKGHGKREGSPIPGVELYETTGDTEINIANALISEGYAISTEASNLNNIDDISNISSELNDLLNFSSNENLSTTKLIDNNPNGDIEKNITSNTNITNGNSDFINSEKNATNSQFKNSSSSSSPSLYTPYQGSSYFVNNHTDHNNTEKNSLETIDTDDFLQNEHTSNLNSLKNPVSLQNTQKSDLSASTSSTSPTTNNWKKGVRS